MSGNKEIEKKKSVRHDPLKLRVFTAFSGYESQCMALDRLKENYPWFDYKIVGWSEIDRPAIASHNANFPEAADKNLGDISKVKWEEVPDFDLFTYSSPCLTGDQEVLTSDGYKPISEIEPGDLVVAKDGKLHPVAKKFDNGLHRTCYVYGMDFDRIHCTLNHKFWTREKYWICGKDPETGKDFRHRAFREPKFVEAKDLTKNHYFGVPVNEDSVPWFSDEEWKWYVIGMYVGDGWAGLSGTKSDGEIVLTLSQDKLDKLRAVVPDSLVPKMMSVIDSGSCFRVVMKLPEIADFVNQNIGRQSDGKRIPYKVLQLPKNLLEAFFNGYLDTDGCVLKTNPNVVQFTSVDKNLIVMTAHIIHKLFHKGCGVYYIKTPDKTVIEGRTVNQKNWYQLRYRKTRSYRTREFYEDGVIWYPFKKLEESEVENVYNIEVTDNHSYVVTACVSANCQDFSSAGIQRGGEPGSGTRSSLLWECERTIREKRPKFLLLENVKALYSDKKFHKLLMRWKRTVDSYGYNSFIKVLNAADYGIPQGRERVFMVSVRKDAADPNPEYYFPKPLPRERKIEDFLEPSAPESAYFDDSVVPKFIDLLENTGDNYDELSSQKEPETDEFGKPLEASPEPQPRTERVVKHRRYRGDEKPEVKVESDELF